MNLEQRIVQAVEPHIGKPLALSGGVDSSTLAYFIKPKFAISVELPGGEKYNEIEWAKKVCEHLRIKHVIVKLDSIYFDEYMRIAVKSIGRPIPHFNIFPLFAMYKKLAETGEKELILGDGPDEVMCGYGRDLIISYLYKIYDFEAFKNYRPLIDRILPRKTDAIEALTNLRGFNDIISADIAMRVDMDDMSNGIAAHFGIKNLRPYQDDIELDEFMRDLPIEEKIHDVEFGKYALRKIAEKYLPKEIAWRKGKIGGPVFPVNLMRKSLGWMEKGEFDKTHYLAYQSQILES